MSKNVIQTIVIVLGVLIIIAFLALIYGMYLKISISDQNLTKLPIIFSFQLDNDEKIKNIEVIDNNRLLVLIESDNNTKGVVYDINNNQIIHSIER